MHGGIYRCTGIYFFKSALLSHKQIHFYADLHIFSRLVQFLGHTKAVTAIETANMLSYGTFGSKSAYPCTVTFYSLRMAARGLNFIARTAGIKPAAIPTKMAKPMAASTSHNGILDKFPLIPIISDILTKRLTITDTP